MEQQTQKRLRIGLIGRIIIGLSLGILIGWLARQTPAAQAIGTFGSILGSLFVGALKAVAPVLIFALVVAAISKRRESATGSNMKPVITLSIIIDIAQRQQSEQFYKA